MSYGSAKKFGRKPTHKRGPITWVDKAGSKPAPFVQALPPLTETRALKPEYEQYLEVGAMWQAKLALVVDVQTAQGKFPSLIQAWWEQDKAPVKQNSLMIYAGIIRIDERNSDGRIISVPRHSFIAGEGRYIISNFDFVMPVV